MQNETFCENCREDVTYTFTEYTATAVLDGVEYQYPARRAVCSKCGAPVWVHSIQDKNLESLYAAREKSEKRVVK